MRLQIVSSLLMITILVSGCSLSSHDDLKDFIAENKRRPPGEIKAAPQFEPYKPFVYDAARLRSPFDPPAVVEKKAIAASSNVKPDLNRQKQRLESFEFSSLSMVGTVKKSGVLWGLVKDPDGAIERVKKGNYLGKNHGLITDLSEQKIDVVEIVPNGVRGWLERPNVISLDGIE